MYVLHYIPGAMRQKNLSNLSRNGNWLEVQLHGIVSIPTSVSYLQLILDLGWVVIIVKVLTSISSCSSHDTLVMFVVCYLAYVPIFPQEESMC